LIAFLKSTILGSNGAQYQHLDTEIRLAQLENPLHLSLFRNDKIIGNITFSRREKNWYVRYFAFNSAFRGSGQNKNNRIGNSFLKKELRQFFQDQIDTGEVNSFYAYIDPMNDQSFLMAEELGFIKSNQVFTQTFSRIHPKQTTRISTIVEAQARSLIRDNSGNLSYFYNQNNIGTAYVLKDETGDIIAFATAKLISWKLIRLPGRFGSILLKTIPYIPGLNRIINPKKHEFIGIDNVWIKHNQPLITEEFFNGILVLEKQKMIIWWTDKMTENTQWGIMHALLNKTPIDLYTLPKLPDNQTTTQFTVVDDFS
jgi:hypothetical protein